MEALLGPLWLPCLVCAIVGVILLSVELCLPGFGVAGIGGFFCSLAVIIMQYLTNDPTTASIVAFIMIVIMVLLLIIFMRSMKKGVLFRSPIVLHENIEATSSSATEGALENLLGAKGVAETMLRPVGTVLIDGKRYSARSEGNFIEKGTEICVISAKGMELIVK